MGYSSFMHASVTRFRAKHFYSVAEHRKYTFVKPHEFVTIVPTITHIIIPQLYFTDPFKLLLEADNYSTFIHISKHILLISNQIHTAKNNVPWLNTLLRRQSLFRSRLQRSQPHNVTETETFDYQIVYRAVILSLFLNHVVYISSHILSRKSYFGETCSM